MSDKLLPSKLVMGKNLLTSIAKASLHALETGEIYVEEEEFLDRLNICRTDECDSFATIEDDDRCTECGCFLSIKAWGAAETCPFRLWPGDVEKLLGEQDGEEE